MNAPRLLQQEAFDDLLLFRLSRVLATAGRLFVRLCEGRHGITRREWRVLAQLGDADGLTATGVARRTQLDKARTSRAIGSLVAKGLLSRETGPADRRQVVLRVTPAGRALIDTLLPQVRAYNRELLADLDPTELARLDALIDHLQLRADALVARHTDHLPRAQRRMGGRRPLGGTGLPSG